MSNTKEKNMKKKMKRWLRILYALLTVVSFVIVLVYVIYKIAVTPPEVVSEPEPTNTNAMVENGPTSAQSPHPDQQNTASYERKPLCYTFLIIAGDQSSGNADTIMVLTYDTVAQSAGLVSIPRDTLIDASYPKINSMYLQGVEKLRSTVADLLGIPIDFYICVDTDGFVEVIDAIDGIEFDIPIHMSYDDPTQDLHIHFEPGLQHLNGEDALKVCRLRKNSDGTMAYPDSDIGRTRTQQQLLITVAKKMLQNPQKIHAYIEIWQDNVETNLKINDMLWFIEPLLNFSVDQDLTTITLPGDGTVEYRGAKWCYQLYPDEVLDIVNQYLNPFKEPLTINDLNIFQAV